MDVMRMFGLALYASRRVLCLVRGGHELVMQFDHRRLSLRCLSCGYRTQGWALGDPPKARLSVPIGESTQWPGKDQRAA